jgi:hypothetical protein
MKSLSLMKRNALAAMSALVLATGALTILPVSNAEARIAHIRTFVSADGKVALRCYYNEYNTLISCDVLSR